jgi:hypothetical protein
MYNTHSPTADRPATLRPGNRVRMRPRWARLCGKEEIRVELISLYGLSLVEDTFSRHRMLASAWDLCRVRPIRNVNENIGYCCS